MRMPVVRAWRGGFGLGVAAGCLGLVAVSGAWGGGVCINEVCYDPEGADEGGEFVEFYNAGGGTVELAGWVLEGGNGAAAGDWRLQWKGEAGDRIEGGGFFLIAGERVAADANARVNLSLQNGPDAVRLRSGDLIRDRVGWGDLVHPEYYVGRPAPDVPAGWALARKPDGADTGSNAGDFAASAMATPGRPNFPEQALVLSGLCCDPPLLGTGESGTLTVTVTNCGTQEAAFSASDWQVIAAGCQLLPRVELAGVLAAGRSRALCWELQAGDQEGLIAVEASLRNPAASGPPKSVSLRIGRGPVWISELQYDPTDEEGEWVELYNPADGDIDLVGWRMSDGSGRTTELGPEACLLRARGCLIVAEDAAGLRAHRPQLDAALVATRSGPWPSLNNMIDRELGYADQVLLCDASGVPCDLVRYIPGDLDGDGITLERWIKNGQLMNPDDLIPCATAGGATPGRAGAGEASAGGELAWWDPQPNPFRPGRPDSGRLCRIALPLVAGSTTRVTADIYSLDGQRVTTLAAAADTHGPTVLVWDGRSGTGRQLPTGLYLVRIALHARVGDDRQTFVRPLALVRG